MSEQIAVRIPDALAESLEDLVAGGRFETKADAIRTALEGLIEAERRKRVGELIVDGYRRIPQDDEDVDLTVSASKAMRGLEAEEKEAGLEW